MKIVIILKTLDMSKKTDDIDAPQGSVLIDWQASLLPRQTQSPQNDLNYSGRTARSSDQDVEE